MHVQVYAHADAFEQTLKFDGANITGCDPVFSLYYLLGSVDHYPGNTLGANRPSLGDLAARP
jgi:hypothetical protein